MREDARRCEKDFHAFIEGAWPSIDPSRFVDGWSLWALTEHLQAVTEGHIKRLLINIPPRSSKSLTASVCWPAWTWARTEKSVTSGPGTRFLVGSYGFDLALSLSDKTRTLLKSKWYQERWGSRFSLKSDGKTLVSNNKGGERQPVSVGGSLIGLGGEINIIDDPHNSERVEGENEREAALNWWREISTTRLNDQIDGAIVVVMQRLHQEDISGYICASDDYPNWTHLMLPAEFDERRRCVTVLKRDEYGEPLEIFEDPREYDGEPMDPNRFPPYVLSKMKAELGPYMASGRLQQEPSPKGGGIIQSEWWQLWPAKGYEPRPGERVTYPEISFCIALLDTAYTEKEENDWSALTILGIWHDDKGHPNIILMEAWRVRMAINGTKTEKGLVQKVIDTCQRRQVDHLLIESKASGISVYQEIRRLMRDGEFQVELWNPTPYGDKVARLYATQPIFSAGLVYSPDKQWAQDVMDEVAAVPKGKHDDYADTISMGIIWLRAQGLIKLVHEADADIVQQQTFQGSRMTIADHYEV